MKIKTQEAVFISMAFVLAILIATACVIACNDLKERGLKNVVEEIWEGKNKESK